MEQNPNSQQSIPEWFSGESNQVPQKSPRNFKPFLILLGVLILVAGVIAAFVAVDVASRPGCLSKSDYAELAGAEYNGTLQPQSAFYTVALDFDSTTNALDTPSQDTITKLAGFYKKHQAKSIQFTLDSSFSSSDAKSLTLSRVLDLQQKLSATGIPTDAIIISQPELIPNEEPDSLASSSFTVSITSLEGCR